MRKDRKISGGFGPVVQIRVGKWNLALGLRSFTDMLQEELLY